MCSFILQFLPKNTSQAYQTALPPLLSFHPILFQKTKHNKRRIFESAFSRKVLLDPWIDSKQIYLRIASSQSVFPILIPDSRFSHPSSHLQIAERQSLFLLQLFYRFSAYVFEGKCRKLMKFRFHQILIYSLCIPNILQDRRYAPVSFAHIRKFINNDQFLIFTVWQL